MIIEEIETRQQFTKYWIGVIILTSVMAIGWAFISLNTNRIKKFTTKEAEAASAELKNIFYTEVFDELGGKDILTVINLDRSREYVEQFNSEPEEEVGEIYIFSPEPENTNREEIVVDNNININNNDTEASESASF